MPPQAQDGREPDQEFAPAELLYRRVALTHIEDGEISLLAISSELKFEEDPPKSTSMLREKYCNSPLDVLHPNCANQIDRTKNHAACYLTVGSLKKGQTVRGAPQDTTELYDLFPFHDPLVDCYAHTTICCAAQQRPNVALKPSKSVREELRRWIAENLIIVRTT